MADFNSVRTLTKCEIYAKTYDLRKKNQHYLSFFAKFGFTGTI